MRKHVKKLWLKALRSGKYKQTKYVLHDASGFCCLGVLCDVYQKQAKKNHKERLVVDKDYIAPDTTNKCVAYNKEYTKLPSLVVEWAGLELDDPVIHGYEDEYGDVSNVYASEVNDYREWDFKRIADAIEKHL